MPTAASVGVTGAGGFIGGHLVRHLAERGARVRAFRRDPGPPVHPRITSHRFAMPDGLTAADFAGLDCVVHAAFQEYDRRHRDADRINLEGTLRLIEVCRVHGVRLVFLSTLSAHDRAESHYGRNKLEVEALFDPARDLVLRLGLVLGPGGLFGDMVDAIRRCPLVPLVGGGRQPIQTLWIGDLFAVLERAAASPLAGRYDLATSRVHTMEELYRAVAAGLGLRRRFVPIPLGAVQLAVRLVELLRLPLAISSENVLGLKQLRAFDTAADVRALGLEPLGLVESIARLLAPPEAGRAAGDGREARAPASPAGRP